MAKLNLTPKKKKQPFYDPFSGAGGLLKVLLLYYDAQMLIKFNSPDPLFDQKVELLKLQL